MTVASIHQNSFVMNVEWSVKILQFVKNYTVASIHQNSFVMNVEFLVAHTLLFYNLKKHYSYCFFRSMKHLTQASHPYLQRVQRETTKMMRNDGGNRQENLKCKKYLHKASTINQGSYLTIYFFSNALLPMDI